MKTWEKIALGTIGGGVLIGGTVYLLRLNQTAVKMETMPTVMVHKLDLTGLTIRIDVTLKNPTRTAFKIKFPFVKLAYKGTSIGSSQVVDKDITIPSFGQAVVQAIMVSVPLLSVFSFSGGLIKAIEAGETAKLNVVILTTIDLGWKKVPFSKTDTVTLSKAKG
jgi:short subunit dehydrogenase-like uncharacterized protein